MAESLRSIDTDWESIELPDVSHLVTEDDTPVESFYQDKQSNLLTDSLDCSWPQGRPFLSAADVAIYPTANESPIVPDMLLSTGVSFPDRIHDKDKRCYYVWLFGKPPEVVIEVVSNRQGHEEGEKLERYARIKVPYYVVYDPDLLLGSRPLRVRQLSGASYVDKVDSWFPEIGLGLCLWEGAYDGLQAQWLRWCDRDGQILLTGRESAILQAQRADTEAQRADALAQRAEAEAQRADAEAQRAEAEVRRRQVLEARLRQLGVDLSTLQE